MTEDNTVMEKIKFLPDGTIDRSLPVLLADNGKFSLQTWNKFCDAVDKANKPLKRVKCINWIIWFACTAAIVLSGAGFAIVQIPENLRRYQGLMIPCALLLMVLACQYSNCMVQKAASNIQKECASASNYDKDFFLELQGDHHDSWYIEASLRNAIDVEISANYDASDVPIAATAEPVAASNGGAKPFSGPAPKKYVKDYETGKVMLNPEYKAWKNAQ